MDERLEYLKHEAMGYGFASAFIDDVGDDSLEHYGRLGQKWYQHIYGEDDPRAAYSNGGEGKNETTDGGSSQKKSFGERRAEKKAEDAKKEAIRARTEKAKATRAAKKAAKEKEEADAKALAEKKAELSKDPRQVLANKELFSNDEIKAAIDRYMLEDRLNQISVSRYPPEKAKSRVDKVMDVLNDTANITNRMAVVANNGVNFYNTAASIYNTFRKPPAEKLPKIEWPSPENQKKQAEANEAAYKARTAKAIAEREEFVNQKNGIGTPKEQEPKKPASPPKPGKKNKLPKDVNNSQDTNAPKDDKANVSEDSKVKPQEEEKKGLFGRKKKKK